MSKLLKACLDNNYEAAKKAINKKHNDTNRCLLVACKNGNTNIVELLLNKHTFDGDILRKVLREACKNNHANQNKLIIKTLLQRGATDYDNRCLYYAVDRNQVDIIYTFIEHSKYQINYDEVLIEAVYSGNFKIALIMLNQGATNIDHALEIACGNGNLEIAKLLIAHGTPDLVFAAVIACIYERHHILQFILTETNINVNEFIKQMCREDNPFDISSKAFREVVICILNSNFDYKQYIDEHDTFITDIDIQKHIDAIISLHTPYIKKVQDILNNLRIPNYDVNIISPIITDYIPYLSKYE